MSDWDSSESPDISESESEENSENDGQENETKQTLLRNICAPTAQPISQNPALICDVLVVDDNSRAHIGHVININGPLTLNNLISSSESSPVNVLNHSFSVSSDTQPDTPSALLEKLSENSSSVTNEKCQYYKTASETTNSPTLGVKFHQATLEIARFFTEHTKIAVTLFIFILIVVVIAIVLVTYVTPRNTDINFNYSTNSMTDMLSSSEYTTVTDTDLNNTSDGDLKIVTRSEWESRQPYRNLTSLKHPVHYVVVSHTATKQCFDNVTCVLKARKIQNAHMNNLKYWDIGFSFLIGGDGRIYIGRGWDQQCTGLGIFNERSICIAFIGYFFDILPSELQLMSGRQLVKLGVKLGKISPHYRLLGLCQISDTDSPGTKFYKELKTWPHWSPTTS